MIFFDSCWRRRERSLIFCLGLSLVLGGKKDRQFSSMLGYELERENLGEGIFFLLEMRL